MDSHDISNVRNPDQKSVDAGQSAETLKDPTLYPPLTETIEDWEERLDKQLDELSNKSDSKEGPRYDSGYTLLKSILKDRDKDIQSKDAECEKLHKCIYELKEKLAESKAMFDSQLKEANDRELLLHNKVKQLEDDLHTSVNKTRSLEGNLKRRRQRKKDVLIKKETSSSKRDHTVSNVSDIDHIHINNHVADLKTSINNLKRKIKNLRKKAFSEEENNDELLAHTTT
ncbi:uncharacterized protein LOC113295396 [Papaver somniferum]|uniref:uncharacterized protein LOC113295396 n=1 Tax=Papaver somniferum TaxID=3469 RepID=UPI000E6F528E|nr:uncharacterized protein LOC113295396 [Papaver somniferum]